MGWESVSENEPTSLKHGWITQIFYVTLYILLKNTFYPRMKNDTLGFSGLREKGVGDYRHWVFTVDLGWSFYVEEPTVYGLSGTAPLSDVERDHTTTQDTGCLRRAVGSTKRPTPRTWIGGN